MLAIAHSLISLLKMVTLIALQQQVAILFLLIKSKCCFYFYIKWQYGLPLSNAFRAAYAKATQYGVENAGIVGLTGTRCAALGTALARPRIKKASCLRRYA
jgi:hypothetical protein